MKILLKIIANYCISDLILFYHLFSLVNDLTLNLFPPHYMVWNVLLQAMLFRYLTFILSPTILL
ncbi:MULTISPECIES: hypothetical protein [Pseudothermotoga]|uniref:hypothetical protein n=1 Tax=Pseudothermotoga TaxID=1643951 RepID=UPI0011871C75|nr:MULTISPECIES: hypothetical protein [Pseudothermotoga]